MLSLIGPEYLGNELTAQITKYHNFSDIVFNDADIVFRVKSTEKSPSGAALRIN